MSPQGHQTGRLSPHSLLQQRYLILGQAGRGGMGAIYRAIDTRLGQRQVAIKEMSQSQLDEEQVPLATARFEQEALMLGGLQHPNLPYIYDSFTEENRSYLVMDFIEGETLFQLLRRQPGKPLPIAQVFHYADQLCDVLAYLHQQKPSIIFRDVKPTNIMITPENKLYLIDFGIARFFKEGQSQDTVLLGSPGYAPPEQHGGAQTNPRTDIYALGATLHYCLTGRDPYFVTEQFSFAPVRRYNPQAPIALEKLIQKMLSPDEQGRPTSTLVVQQVLKQIQYSLTLSPPVSTSVESVEDYATRPLANEPEQSSSLEKRRFLRWIMWLERCLHLSTTTDRSSSHPSMNKQGQ